MDLNLYRTILMPIFLFTGTTGNILSFITVTNKHCKKSSYTVYLAGLAIADLLTLYVTLIERWILQAFDIPLTAIGPAYCKLNVFFVSLFSGLSIWITVLLATERAFCMYRPFHAKSVCKPKNAVIAMAVLVTIVLGYSSHYIYGIQMKLSPSGNHVQSSLAINDSSTFGQSEDTDKLLFDDAIPSGLKNHLNDDNKNNNSISNDNGDNAGISRFITGESSKPGDNRDAIPMFNGNNLHTRKTDNETQSALAVGYNSTCINRGNRSRSSTLHACRSSYLKSDNQTAGFQRDVVCDSSALNSDSLSGRPAVGDCNSTDLRNNDIDQFETPPSATCNSTDSDESAPPSSPEDVSENCDLEETQSPSSHEPEDDSIHLPTSYPQNRAFCGFVSESYINFYRSWIWFDSMALFCVPVVILICCNTATWVKVYRSSRGPLLNATNQMIRRTRHVMILTSLISITFILSVSPLTVLFALESVLVDDMQYPLYNEENRAVLELIAECLYLCNPTCNFFLYIVSGKRFRKSLKAAFCKAKPQQATPRTELELRRY